MSVNRCRRCRCTDVDDIGFYIIEWGVLACGRMPILLSFYIVFSGYVTNLTVCDTFVEGDVGLFPYLCNEVHLLRMNVITIYYSLLLYKQITKPN